MTFGPFKQVCGRNEAGAGRDPGQFDGLPPEGVCLVHDLQNLSLPEGHTSICAGDGRVRLRVVVHHGTHVQLMKTEQRRYRSHTDMCVPHCEYCINVLIFI